jgi:hypothetical protein
MTGGFDGPAITLAILLTFEQGGSVRQTLMLCGLEGGVEHEARTTMVVTETTTQPTTLMMRMIYTKIGTMNMLTIPTMMILWIYR